MVINCLLAATGFHWHEYRNQIVTINFVCFLFIGFAVWVVTKSLQQYLCFLFLLWFLLFGGVGVADVAKIRIQKMIHSISICFSPNKLKTKHDTQIVLKWYNSLYKASILALFYKNKMTKLFFSITENSDNLQFSSAVVWEIMEDALYQFSAELSTQTFWGLNILYIWRLEIQKPVNIRNERMIYI